MLRSFAALRMTLLAAQAQADGLPASEAKRKAVPAKSWERLFEGDLEAGGEELGGAVAGDDHVIFAAQAEFAGDVDAGLVGEGHAGLEDGCAAADEVRMLVAIEAEAVAYAMGEEFVVWAKARGSDDSAGGIVDGTGEFASTSGARERCPEPCGRLQRRAGFFRRVFREFRYE